MSGQFTIQAIHLGHFPEIDSDEGNISTENPEVLLGFHGSDAAPLHQQIVTLQLDSGSDDLQETDNAGSDPVRYDLGSGTVRTVFDMVAVMDATLRFVDGSQFSGIFYVVEDLSGNVFVLSASGNPDLAQVTPVSFEVTDVSAHGAVSAIYDLKNSSETYSGFLCLGEGRLIATDRGQVAVEKLQIGDRLITRDHEAQLLRWIGKRTVRLSEENPAVVVGAGHIGKGRPNQDLVLSAQHCVMLAGAAVELSFGVDEVFVRARHLGEYAALQMHGRMTWYTLLTDQHEVIFANGLPVESFLPGREGFKALTQAAIAQVKALFPALYCDPGASYGPATRRILRRWEAEVPIDQLRVNSRFSAPYCASATPARIRASA